RCASAHAGHAAPAIPGDRIRRPGAAAGVAANARPRNFRQSRRRTCARARLRARPGRDRGGARCRRPRLAVAMDRAVIAADAHWVPSQVRWTPEGPLVDWCHLGDLRFTAAFFEQTIGAAMGHPFNLLFRRSTPLETIEENDFELRPAGLIFHMSR